MSGLTPVHGNRTVGLSWNLLNAADNGLDVHPSDGGYAVTGYVVHAFDNTVNINKSCPVKQFNKWTQLHYEYNI